jgi:hypothetical protein
MAKTNGHGGHATAASTLTTAAAGLETELRRYVELAAAAVRTPLTSEKTLERATKAMSEAAESEQRVLAQVAELAQAIATAREAQQSSTDALNAHRAAIGQRRTELDALLARFAALGEVAKTMNTAMQKIAGYKGDPYPAGAPDAPEDGMQKALAEMAASMTVAAGHAQDLASEATAKEFEDIARQAESLRQQILAVKNRLSLLQR